MKERHHNNDNVVQSTVVSHLKRPESCTFSIANIIENSKRSSCETDAHCPKTSSSLTSTIDETESTASAAEYFYIDENDECHIKNQVEDRSSIMALVIPTKVGFDDDCKTGLVFEASLQHYDRHNRFHQERPIRITSIQDALIKSGLYRRCFKLEERNLSSKNNNLSAEMRFLNDNDFLRVHLPGYIQRLEKLSTCNCDGNLDCEEQQFKSIYLTTNSLQEAKYAASSLCHLVTKVVGRPNHQELDNGFAIIRPPGHHAEPALAGGYCIINNIAVAAAFARNRLSVKRILIVDWDVHHGNGTQSIFINDPNVLYFSVHRWQGGNYFPFLQNSGPLNVGTGHGTGFNVNVGWNRKGVGDMEYLAVWETILLPMAREFQPELILVSAGFDAAEGDMGECNVSHNGFRLLTQGLQSLNSKIVCSLEGGYVRSVIGKCVTEVIRALLDRTSAEQYVYEIAVCHEKHKSNLNCFLDVIDSSAAKNIRATIAAHKSYWKCFQ